uniref:C-type lectin domain-containing protein n=1 Tax=Oryzias latipes TaxID=8090 RepID=A0A3P9LRE2_ORYLA
MACDLTNGWVPFGSNCYKLNTQTRKSWSAARHDCVQEGGDLVSITSEEENTYVAEAMGPTHLDLWIGLSTLDGVFKWVDKTDTTFSNYGPGWPRNTEGSWDCGQIFTGRSCSILMFLILVHRSSQHVL